MNLGNTLGRLEGSLTFGPLLRDQSTLWAFEHLVMPVWDHYQDSFFTFGSMWNHQGAHQRQATKLGSKDAHKYVSMLTVRHLI